MSEELMDVLYKLFLGLQ